MPIYEYRCNNCNKKSSIFFRSISQAEQGGELSCPRCGGNSLRKLFSRFAFSRAADEGQEIYEFDKMMSGVDEDDPKSVARWAKNMSREVGEDFGSEFDEAMERIESGEEPESVLDEVDKSNNGT
jgi:putative FmdB family regulatory protein